MLDPDAAFALWRAGTLFENALAGSDGSATVHIYMPGDQPSSEPGTFMNAPGTTGIFATDDGGTWAGAIALPLPFP